MTQPSKSIAELKAEMAYQDWPKWHTCRNCRWHAIVRGNYECHFDNTHFRVTSMGTCRHYTPTT